MGYSVLGETGGGSKFKNNNFLNFQRKQGTSAAMEDIPDLRVS